MSERLANGYKTSRFIVALAGVVTALASSFSISPAAFPGHTSVEAREEPQAIYSADPNDPWNIIFYHLFTRPVKARLTDDFPSGAPFIKVAIMGYPDGIRCSQRLFEQLETGDRAIEPLYPSFLSSTGIKEVLKEPRFSRLTQALSETLNEPRTRPVLHRALMQADAWAAYDLIARVRTEKSPETAAPVSRLLPLLARFIKKLALTPEEIRTLPDNYAAAARHHDLPALFAPESGWLEVEWLPTHMHDHESDFRCAARVFVKVITPVSDRQAFLNALRDNRGEIPEIKAVALVRQNLLVRNDGKIVSSPLTCEVQTRTFERERDGKIIKSDVRQYELSRRLLLAEGQAGGLFELDEKAPAYLAASGNDYGFATPQFRGQGDAPVIGTLSARCAACHGRLGGGMMTFQFHPPEPIPSGRFFTQPNDLHAGYVASKKAERDDFKFLLTEWNRR